MLQGLQRLQDLYLEVPADWPLSPELRAAADRVRAEAAPRLRAVSRAWAQELHAPLASKPLLSPRQREAEVALALYNRLLNEGALNALDTAGDAHDRWRSDVDAKAGWCRNLWTRPKWSEVLLRIDRLPAADRIAALAHESEVLSRWGQPRPAVPARPAFSLDHYATGLIARLQAGRADQRPPVAMVPVVAAHLLKDDAPLLAGSDTDAPPPRSLRCAGLQWALANARAERAAAPAELAAAFQHALIFRAEDLERQPDTSSEHAKALAAQGYPLHVARQEVTGTVQVRVVRDEKGTVSEARVVERKLTAPGLQNRRPVFVETALDAASLAKARALPAGKAGVFTVEFVWMLE